MQQGLSDELYNLVSNYATTDAFTTREKLAIEFAERFAFNHTGMDDDMWSRVKAHFSDQDMDAAPSEVHCQRQPNRPGADHEYIGS